jgi:hypothetical protein
MCVYLTSISQLTWRFTLKVLDQASDLDFTSSSSSPSESLLKPNFEISKLFQIMDFALANSSISQTGEDANPLFEGLDLSPREELMKKVNVFYEFEVRNAEGEREAWWVDMKVSEWGIRPL